MKQVLDWWYRISLPKRKPDTTPAERERTRYARLTSQFTLIILVIKMALAPTTFWGAAAANTTNHVLALAGFGLLLLAIFFGKGGWNILAATLVIVAVTGNIIGDMLSLPLDAATVPAFGTLVVTVILAGSLMPPIGALFTGLLNGVIIVLMVLFQPHTTAFEQMTKVSTYTMVLALLVATQIGVGMIIFIILRNLIATLRRADRADQIIVLQKIVAHHEQTRLQDQEQLKEGLALIAQIHTAIANGNLNVSVPSGSDGVLWQVGVPLNNLVRRVRHWKEHADQFEKTQAVIEGVATTLRKARAQHHTAFFQQRTGTPMDVLLPEINALSAQTSDSKRSQ